MTARRGLTRLSHRASVPFLLPWCASFEHRAIPNQVRDVPLPERPLLGLAVAGQEQRERPVLDPNADRVVVLVLTVLGRLGKHRQDDRPQFDLAGALRGIDRLMPLSRTRRSSFR